jgi:hypothetical protein
MLKIFTFTGHLESKVLVARYIYPSGYEYVFEVFTYPTLCQPPLYQFMTKNRLQEWAKGRSIIFV